MFKKTTPVTNGKIDTLIGAATTIEGHIQASGILRVEGRIRGELVSEGDIIIGEKGDIRANIKARHVTVAGKVQGNISASGRMHLVSSGQLLGDVEAATVIIEEGAQFKGACKMTETSNGKSKPSKVETMPEPSELRGQASTVSFIQPSKEEKEPISL